MRTRTLRGVGAAVLSLGLVATAFTSAQAASDPTPGTSARTPMTRLTTLQANAARAFGQSTGSLSSAAAVTGITPMSSVCPAGQFPKTRYSHESFETVLPFPAFSNGFTVATGVGAPDGQGWANSSLAANPTPTTPNILDSNHAAVPQTGKVYLSFSYRGTFEAGTTAALITADYWEPAPAPEWTAVTLDITSQATTTGDGTVDVAFGHVANPTTAASFDVDNVNIYTCAAAPNSGIRGDWTGQGTVDLIATRTDGSLWAYEGKGDGTVQSGVNVGSGWSSSTWKGSPGDVNADKRTDLLARRSDGTLWFYPGRGYGLLGTGKQVGNGWNIMTAIATPGDVDLDGRPDLVARRSDGTLHLYRILATGALSYVRQIGSGWNIMTSIIGMGDVNGDKRGDITGIRSDGIMFSYLSNGSGLTGSKQVGSGWKIMNWLTSPGDMNKDGHADLIARRTLDGTLWFYPGRTGGGVYSGKPVSAGWDVMASIL